MKVMVAPATSRYRNNHRTFNTGKIPIIIRVTKFVAYAANSSVVQSISPAHNFAK